MPKRTLTEEQEIVARKIYDMLGNSQIRFLKYEFTNGEKEKIHWIDSDEFEFKIESNWVKGRKK